MDTAAAHLTPGELVPVVVPSESDVVAMAARLGVGEQLDAVIAMTASLFHRPVRCEISVDPENPLDHQVVLLVSIPDSTKEAVDLEAEWCHRLAQFGSQALLAIGLQFEP